MNFLALLLAMTVNDTRETAFLTWYQMEQVSATGDAVTFQPRSVRLHDKVKLVVRLDESSKLLIKRSLDPETVRRIAKSFLQQTFSSEEAAEMLAATAKKAHFESRFPNGAMVTMDDEEGWLQIFVGRNDGPKIGLSFTSYKIRVD